MRSFLFLLSFLSSFIYIHHALAASSDDTHAEEIFPPACIAFSIQGEALEIPASKPRVLMLHNLSAFDLWITHTGSETSPDGWSSRLQGNHWSALALDKTSIALTCVESKPGHEQQVSCEHVLAACTWPITSRPKHTHGIFWAGENMPLTTLTATIGRRGFELPPEAQ